MDPGDLLHGTPGTSAWRRGSITRVPRELILHYVFREVRTNLLAWILGDWCCGKLLLHTRVRRMNIKSGRVPSTEFWVPDSHCSVSAVRPVTKSPVSQAYHVFVQTLGNSSVFSTQSWLVFAKKTFLIPFRASPPTALTRKLFALSNWEGMGRANKSLTFCSKSFLCPSGLVKFGQAFLLPFGP